MPSLTHTIGTKIGFGILHNWSKITSNIDSNEYYYKRIFSIHPEYRRPLEPNIEKAHIKLWKSLRSNINLNTLRVCSNISGNTDLNYVPEAVFHSDIQRSLCGWQEKIMYIANKSFYHRWYQNDVFPKTYINNIDGDSYDDKYEIVSKPEVLNILKNLKYPVVFKPNIGSMGGANVYFLNNQKEVQAKMEFKKNYIIQEMIQQNKFFAKYNNYGLNTIRVNLYRSIIDNKINYLHAALRMGTGKKLDNVTAGGISCFIRPDGYLNYYAHDKFLNKYEKHPDTNLTFSEDSKIPLFEEMKSLAIKIAREMFFARLISLDMCLDEKQKWRVIEINLNDITLRFAQHGGEPFFGQYTEEVIEYCRNNPWWKNQKFFGW